MQPSFDFTGLREQLGESYDSFIEQWKNLQAVLAGRGKALPKAGRILASMRESYGPQFLKKCCQFWKAPSWRRAQMMIEVYEWFGDREMTDETAAVLDSIFGPPLRRELRLKAYQWIRDGKTAQDIDDLLESVGTPPGSDPPQQAPTEDEIRKWHAAQLEADGWEVRLEQPTRDGGAVDIVATRDGEMMIVECKTDLDRKTAYYAIGQLAVYAQTFRTKNWRIGFWREDKSAEKVCEICRGMVTMVHVGRPVTSELQQ
jgi:Holliday junction resolvase-like predicted endonuclease